MLHTRWRLVGTILTVFAGCAWVGVGCSGTEKPSYQDMNSEETADARLDLDSGPQVDTVDSGTEEEVASPLTFTVMTFNVGTTDQLLHDEDEKAGQGDGYTSEHAAWISEYCSNNLAWKPAEEALREFISSNKPDVIAFQEMYFDPWCEDEPDPPDELEIVCEGYTPTRPLTVERLVGDQYWVASAQGHADNWVAVRKEFGTLVGCEGEGACLEGATGFGVPDCCSGGRVSSIGVKLPDGRILTVVNVHTNAGMTSKDQACRVRQIEQIFLDRGDGQPAANGVANVIMGDMNTDFLLLAAGDPSADRWNDFVGEGKAFHFVSSPNPQDPATHASGIRLDHVASDVLTGSCLVMGASEGTAPVMASTFFDHRPVLCQVTY